jgi:hypothetical protein
LRIFGLAAAAEMIPVSFQSLPNFKTIPPPESPEICWLNAFYKFRFEGNEAHHEAYRHSFQLFITVRTNGIHNASICNDANFNLKSYKSQKIQISNTFSNFSLHKN